MITLWDHQGLPIKIGGFKIPDPNYRSSAPPFVAPSRILPVAGTTNLDWVKIENQYSLGSCVANAVTSDLEYLIRKEYGLICDLSRLWMYARARMRDGTPLDQDVGLYIETAMRTAEAEGCPLESHYPYDQSKFSEVPPAELSVEAEKNKLLFRYYLPSVDAIRESILQGFPGVLGIVIMEGMLSDECMRTGEWSFRNATGRRIGGHALFFVAYDGDWIIVANSWGTDVGARGYFRIHKDLFDAGFVFDVQTGRVVGGGLCDNGVH